MKAEINNENKAKFFALYWGQRLIDCNRYAVPVALTSILVSMPSTDFESIIGQSKILLKPLSSISDEDAKECGVRSEAEKQTLLKSRTWVYVNTDYLRSKGYALPWMGLSVEEMVEAGWIKLIES